MIDEVGNSFSFAKDWSKLGFYYPIGDYFNIENLDLILTSNKYNL